MAEEGNRKVTAKDAVIIIFVAIAVAVVSTLVQHLIMGKAHPAITGGVVGGAIAAMAILTMKRTSR